MVFDILVLISDGMPVGETGNGNGNGNGLQ